MHSFSSDNEVVQTKSFPKLPNETFEDACQALERTGQVYSSDPALHTLTGEVRVLDRMIDVRVSVEARSSGSIVTVRAPKAAFPDLSGQAAVKNFLDALERPDMHIRRAGVPVSSIRQYEPVPSKGSSFRMPYIVGGIALLLAIGGFVFSRLNSKPSQAAVEQAIQERRGFHDYVPGNDVHLISYDHSQSLVSKGGYGPEGTPVYTVRATFLFVDPQWGNSKYTRDIYFWKDPFGHWVHTFVN